MLDFAVARRNMVDCQLRTFDVNDRALLAAMAEIPRERYVPADQAALAYLDRTLTVGEAPEPRFLLAPMILARLIQALAIQPGEKVLDVASGAGYSAEIMRRLGGKVVEADADPAAGAPSDGPFGAILINGAVELRPDVLLDQLADGGRLACLWTDGQVSVANLYVRSGEATGARRLFDASAPVLPGFRREATFAF